MMNAIMSWQLLTVISILGLSISVILQRTLMHRYKTDPFAYAVVFQGLVGILLMAVALLVGFKLPGIQLVIIPAILSVIFFGVGHIIYAKTLQKVEASAFSVLFATQAVWIMIFGIVLLGESLTALQVIGSVLIFIGVALLIKNISSVFKDKGTLLGLLTGLLFGVAIIAWSYVGQHTNTISWAAISFVGTSFVAFLVHPQSVRKMRPLIKPRVLATLVLLAIFYGIGSLAMLFAYNEGSLAIISPLRQTSIIVTVLFALVLLPQERNRIRRKIIAALVCAIGVILIVV
jgi:drug/metabolite transporter (DMT)-like permease